MAGHAEFVFCEQSIERTFSWIDQNRRMSKDYEKLAETGETFVLVAMSRLKVRRLPAHEAFQTVSHAGVGRRR